MRDRAPAHPLRRTARGPRSHPSHRPLTFSPHRLRPLPGWAGRRSAGGTCVRAPGGHCIYRGRMLVSSKSLAPRRTGAVQTPSPACIRCAPQPFSGFDPVGRGAQRLCRAGSPREFGPGRTRDRVSLPRLGFDPSEHEAAPPTCGRHGRSRPRHLGHGCAGSTQGSDAHCSRHSSGRLSHALNRPPSVHLRTRSLAHHARRVPHPPPPFSPPNPSPRRSAPARPPRPISSLLSV